MIPAFVRWRDGQVEGYHFPYTHTHTHIPFSPGDGESRLGGDRRNRKKYLNRSHSSWFEIGDGGEDGGGGGVAGSNRFQSRT